MTIVKAKKILGVTVEVMTDKQVQEIIDCFSVLIEVGIQRFELIKTKQEYLQRRTK